MDFCGELPSTSPTKGATMYKIATLTMNPALDLYGATENLLVGSKSRCGKQVRDPGGGGINVARGIHELGGEVLTIYPAGGASGDELETLLASRNIPQKRIPIAGRTRENVVIREESTGKPFHFVFPGPELSEAEWQQCLDTIKHLHSIPDYLVISGSLPPGVPFDFYTEVVRAANSREIRVILDTSGPALTQVLENAGVYLVKPNRLEFQRLGVAEGADHDTYLDAMEKLILNGTAQVVIVTLGAEGALLVSREGERYHLRPPQTEDVSPVGAGDSFVALLVYQLTQGSTLLEAFRYGVAAAAAAVKTPGTELYRSDSIERMYRRVKA